LKHTLKSQLQAFVHGIHFIKKSVLKSDFNGISHTFLHFLKVMKYGPISPCFPRYNISLFLCPRNVSVKFQLKTSHRSFSIL